MSEAKRSDSGNSDAERRVKWLEKNGPKVNYPTIPWSDLFRLEENLARDEGTQLTGLNIKADDNGWFVILKGVRNGRKVVHFTGGTHWEDALEAIAYEVAHQRLSWRPDKY